MRWFVPAVGALAAGFGPADRPVYPAAGVVQFRGGGPVAAGQAECAPADGVPAARRRINPDGTFTP